jgi:hypothetical protein
VEPNCEGDIDAMKQRFSDRMGITGPVPIQLESMNSSLRNSLWNILLSTVFSGGSEYFIYRVQYITAGFFRLPRDEVPKYGFQAKNLLKQFFFHDSFSWWSVYNLLEFIADHPKEILGTHSPERFTEEANRILEEEAAGYRFVENVLTPITNPSEISSIEDAIEASRAANLFGAQEHLKAAIDLLSKRPNPDYRNSIKESISSLESLVKQISGEEGGGLDKALAKLDEKVKFHGAFRSGLLSLYGYTSDEDGIRHAILEEPNLGFDEAKFMLVACSALVNFIISKANKHGLLPPAKG